MRATWMMILATLAIACTMAVAARAESPPEIPLPAHPDIARVEAYLAGITTLTADFTQTAADGSVSKGKFFLKRPGKMRWQYAAPTPILLVSDGKSITYYDAELDQVSYIGVDETLAGFLAQKEIKLESPTTRLTQFESNAGTIRATMTQKAKPEEGSLTLVFSDNPVLIREMQIVDATGQTSRVVLTNPTFGTPLENELFQFIDPRGNKRRNQQ